MYFVLYTLAAMLSIFVTMVLVAYIRTKTRYANLWMWNRNEEMYFPPVLIGIAWPVAMPITLAVFAAIIFTARNG